jgi:pimeloyl-ACP methyl ester carboxylesterase
MMRRVKTYLPRVLCIVGMSLLLIAPAPAESIESAEAPASQACATRTGLYCEIYGSGDPILFLHGLGGSLYSWRNQKALSDQYRVILIDFRGAGDSPKPNDKHYSIKEQADLIYEFIHEHNLNNLTIVGNSYGGAVSLLLAIRLGEEYPRRLSNLILIDAGAYPDHLPSHLTILRVPIIGWLAVHLIPSKAQVRRVLRDSYYAPCKITREQIAAYARPIAAKGGRHALLQLGKKAIPPDIKEIIARYPTIKARTLILWGENDRLLRRDVAERLDKAIPDSTLEFIKFAGHVPQEEQPEATNCRIRAFLNPTITCPPQTPEPPICRR